MRDVMCGATLSYAKTLLDFFHLSWYLFVTLVHNYPIAVYKSGLARFVIYNRFGTTVWNCSRFFLISFLHFLLTIHVCFCAGEITDSVINSPLYTSIVFIDSFNFLHFYFRVFLLSVIAISMPKNVCFFPQYITSSPKCFFILAITSVATSDMVS